jgi:hypothetical protein
MVAEIMYTPAGRWITRLPFSILVYCSQLTEEEASAMVGQIMNEIIKYAFIAAQKKYLIHILLLI